MSGSNGTQRRVFHAVAKTEVIPIEVDRGDGALVVDFIGYHRERCPVWVDIEVEAARQAYLDAAFKDVEVDDGNGGKKTESQYEYSREVEARYRRDVLIAVVQGLQEKEADVLMAGDGWLEILTLLGWWHEQRAEAEAADDDPEASGEAAEAPTTAPSSPASRRSTARTTGKP